MPLFRPYHYGEYKWDEYLIDIHGALQVGNRTASQTQRNQKAAVSIAHEQRAELQSQTAELKEIGEALETGFEELRSEFQWGFTLIADRMVAQIDQLSEVTAQLDAIRNTLTSPLLTQARELFQLGQEYFRKGLLDKSLETYLKAEQKVEVDFLLQLQIGKLYLYGRDEDDNVINLAEAERHFLLAARYANAEKEALSEWSRYCGEAYFHCAVTAYLLGEQSQAESDFRTRQACLERALGYLRKAAVLWPRFTEVLYLQAKCHSLLGQREETLQILGNLADRDRRYFAKAAEDPDFESVTETLESVVTNASRSPGPIAQATAAKLEEVDEAIAWARRAKPSPKECEATEAAERELRDARSLLHTTAVDIEGLSEKLDDIRGRVDSITQKSFEQNIATCCESFVASESKKRRVEQSMAELKAYPQHQSGDGMAWLFCIMFVIGTIVLLHVLFNDPPIWLQVLGAIGAWVVGGILKDPIVDWRHNTRVKNDAALAIDQCVREMQSLGQQEEEWKQEMRRFAAWQAQHSHREARTA